MANRWGPVLLSWCAHMLAWPRLGGESLQDCVCLARVTPVSGPGPRPVCGLLRENCPFLWPLCLHTQPWAPLFRVSPSTPFLPLTFYLVTPNHTVDTHCMNIYIYTPIYTFLLPRDLHLSVIDILPTFVSLSLKLLKVSCRYHSTSAWSTQYKFPETRTFFYNT